MVWHKLRKRFVRPSDTYASVFEFEVESTTDWFCIGIKDSKLRGQVAVEVIKGEITKKQHAIDHFLIMPGGGLNARFNAIFDICSRDKTHPNVLFVRKGNRGELTIKAYIEHKGEKYLFAIYGPLSRSSARQNEVEYSLLRLDERPHPM